MGTHDFPNYAATFGSSIAYYLKKVFLYMLHLSYWSKINIDFTVIKPNSDSYATIFKA